MNNKILLIIGIGLVIFSINSKYIANRITIPNIPIVAPELTKNIYYDEYDKCKDLSIQYNKKLVLIFSADWCPYCRILKKDIDNIILFKQYIVCFIDTDKNKNLVEKYEIKGLPTSVIIDSRENELSRKMGYKQIDYNKWLDSNLLKESVSWIKD